jgi:hypothetical protein
MRASPSPLISSSSRVKAARAALSICAHADALAREADAEVDAAADDHRLFALLEQRETISLRSCWCSGFTDPPRTARSLPQPNEWSTKRMPW